MARARPRKRAFAFLRGINLGKRRLEMGRLVELFEELGLTDVSTFIASGNVIFDTSAAELHEMEPRIEAHLEKSLGYAVDTLLRSADEVAAIAAYEPFPDHDFESDGASVQIVFLRQPPSITPETLAGFETPRDRFQLRGRELYWLSMAGVSGTLVTWRALEKALGVSQTTRNQNTVRKLAARHVPG